MPGDAGYRYTNLTSAIADKASPLRRYFGERFPNVRAIQAAYRTASGPLLVPGGTADPAILGAAFDFMIRMTLDGDYVPEVAIAAFRNRADMDAIAQVAHIGGDAARGCRHTGVPPDVARAGWALALCTEVYRQGPRPGSVLERLYRQGRFTPSGLLGTAPGDAIRQLSALHDVAVERLYPDLPQRFSNLALGPAFTGSRWCNADADLIVDGQLIDVKTQLGRLNKKTGRRSDSLPPATVYQLLGYALFDSIDAYRITAVGMYSARYGTLQRWNLHHFLRELAGVVVDVAAERSIVWHLLGGR